MSAVQKKKQQKKPLSPLSVLVIVVMFAIFCAQMLFPTNLGEKFDEKTHGVSSINVSMTSGKEDTELKAFNTDSGEDIRAFSEWAKDKTMRNRSLADGLTADAKTMIKYNFQIQLSDGSYEAIVIDERGFVHIDSQLFKLAEDPVAFIQELESILETW